MAEAAEPTDLAEFKALRARAKRAWTDRDAWQRVYDDAYDYAIPMRRPPKYGDKGPKTADRVFDNTAMTSALRFAGQLQQDLFPPGQTFFTLKPGPFAKQALEGKDLLELQQKLEEIAGIVRAMVQTAEWDQATHEMCIDLAVGTGIILMLEGDAARPLRFVCVPNDEAALELDGFNAVSALHWKTRMTRRALKDAFPQGRYPQAFHDAYAAAGGPEGELDVHQSFVQEGKRWLMRVWIENSEGFIETGTFRTKPFLSPRYCRVPGEAYGRGPILFALPTIKTLNKAQELTLKSAAIGMLGIWGYRPGGAFNPDTARLAPGAFWPVGSTGGVLGAEVSRLDTPMRIDLANLILQDGRAQIQQALHDNRLPQTGATPKSASEILEHAKQAKQNYVGAFSRLINETVPDVVRRAIDVGFRMNLIDYQVDVDEFLVAIDVLSPIAAAMRIDHLSPIIKFLELVMMTRPQSPEDHLEIDAALDHVGSEMGVPAKLLVTPEKRAANQKARADAMMQQQLLENAKPLADAAATAAELPA